MPIPMVEWRSGQVGKMGSLGSLGNPGNLGRIGSLGALSLPILPDHVQMYSQPVSEHMYHPIREDHGKMESQRENPQENRLTVTM